MNNANGFIKLHRKMVLWGWYQDTPVKCLFLHLLLTANFTEGNWRGEIIKPGQLVTGIKRLSSEIGLTEQQTRTALKKLQSTNEITIKPTNKYSVITVVNWEKYQGMLDEATNKLTYKQQTNNNQITRNLTNNQHSTNIQSTFNQQQYNNYNNDNNIKEFEEDRTARARKGDIKDGKIFVDEVNGWVPLEVPEEIREHYDSYLILGLIDEHGNYIYNKDEDED